MELTYLELALGAFSLLLTGGIAGWFFSGSILAKRSQQKGNES